MTLALIVVAIAVLAWSVYLDAAPRPPAPRDDPDEPSA